MVALRSLTKKGEFIMSDAQLWETIQWMASVFGMLGAIANCLGGRFARWTWPVWLFSNVLGIAALAHLNAFGFLAKELFFTGTSLVGGIRVFMPVQWSSFCAFLGGMRVRLYKRSVRETRVRERRGI